MSHFSSFNSFDFFPPLPLSLKHFKWTHTYSNLFVYLIYQSILIPSFSPHHSSPYKLFVNIYFAWTQTMHKKQWFQSCIQHTKRSDIFQNKLHDDRWKNKSIDHTLFGVDHCYCVIGQMNQTIRKKTRAHTHTYIGNGAVLKMAICESIYVFVQ